MTSSYQAYSTETKLIFAFGQEETFFNRRQLHAIPSSNKSRWRNDHPKRYFEYEVSEKFRSCFQNGIDIQNTPGLQTIVTCYLSIFGFFHSILSKAGVEMKKHLFMQRSETVDFVQQLIPSISLDNILSCFDISRSTYYYWLKEELFKCHSSLFSKCFKRHPLQLSNSETRMIRELLVHPNYHHWSVDSLQRFAVKQNMVHACAASFYKVKRLFQLERKRTKKPKYITGIRADKPNEIWHADITNIKTPNGNRFYLYMIMDNFSRRILNWYLDINKSGVLWASLLKRTYQMIHTNNSVDLNYWTDDGSENCNAEMENCITELDIKHVVAQKDVHLSNSMIEAVFRIFSRSFTILI